MSEDRSPKFQFGLGGFLLLTPLLGFGLPAAWVILEFLGPIPFAIFAGVVASQIVVRAWPPVKDSP